MHLRRKHTRFVVPHSSSLLAQNISAAPSSAASTPDLSCIRDDFPRPPNTFIESGGQGGFVAADGKTTVLSPEDLDSFTPIPQRIFKPRGNPELTNLQDSLLSRCPKRGSSQSCERTGTRLEIVHEASDEESSVEIERVSRGLQGLMDDHQIEEDRVEHSPGAPVSLWDALDMELGSMSSINSANCADTLDPSFPRPRKLRKSQSAVLRDRGVSTLTVSSTTPSVPTHKKLRKRMRSTSSPMLRPTLPQPLHNLPNGVQQIGNGIGYNPVASPARRPESVYRTALRSCQSLFSAGLPALRYKLSKRSLRESLEPSEPETTTEAEHAQNVMTVMREIYGNNWTLGMVPVPMDHMDATSPSNDSEGPLTPESPPFKQPVGIALEDAEPANFRVIPSSGLHLHMRS
ncbi:hypothetical protein BV22DRAFT_660257 [Leucogyrophana mollusca]|uniref:Uncharacterized protein n=1 Tax=Leucogyrophana mollusca TaxID=85980 RepID=A0ACB8BBS0_9AGAM|nr:hypothetical protein BV22DRAFT_660257 [Leucogyrophana mollusca]